MLSAKEEEFLAYWEASRGRQKKIIYQLLVGLPLGLVLGILVIANFFSGWYKQADMVANGSFNPMVLYVAVALIAIFFAIFSKRFQWDQSEQRYKELKQKKEKLSKQAQAANAAAQESIEKPDN
jgi:uncharacterized membrane protein